MGAELIWKGKDVREVPEPASVKRMSLYGGSGDGWRNRLYPGDCLFVSSLLLDEFRGRIGLIYIDPPYMTGKSFSARLRVAGSVFEVPTYDDAGLAGVKLGRRSIGCDSSVLAVHTTVKRLLRLEDSRALGRDGVHGDAAGPFAVLDTVGEEVRGEPAFDVMDAGIRLVGVPGGLDMVDMWEVGYGEPFVAEFVVVRSRDGLETFCPVPPRPGLAVRARDVYGRMYAKEITT